MALSFVACNDDDDDKIRFYDFGVFPDKIKEIEAGTINGRNKTSYATIAGGTQPYTATSSNQQVIKDAEIWVDNEYGENRNTLSFIVTAPGETTITVTDSKGNTADLKVTVKLSSYLYTVGKSRLVINDEVDETIKNQIQSGIAQSNLVEGNSYKLIYTPEGAQDLVVYSDAHGLDEKWTGTFWYESNDGEGVFDFFLVMNYNGTDHSYQMFSGQLSDQKSDDQPLTKWVLVENLTKEYQLLYPSANITEVQYGFNVNLIDK